MKKNALKAKAKKKPSVAIISMQPHWKELDNENYIRLPQELRKLGYRAKILFYDKFFVSFGDKIEFYYNEKRFNIDDYKLYIPIMAGNKGNQFLVEVLEAMGAKIKNNLKAISVAKDKARTLLILHQAGLPTIPAAMNFSEYHLSPLLQFLDEDDYVCKLVDGSLGKGVGYIHSRLSLISMFELMASADIRPSQLLFEKFIKEAAGKDIRVIATNKRVIAAMERRSNGFDFRANLWGGGTGYKYKISSEMKKIAIKAINALGLDYGGVDFLETKEGPVIIEVNANPGLHIENATGINVAREIVKHLLKN